MKKLVCMILIALLTLTAAFAETIYVTISDESGDLAIAGEAFDVSDVDGDGVVSISDALYIAHEAQFEGGAEAGFATGDFGYGLSLTKLWGVENGGSYGYYVNNGAAMSLADALSDGDEICAFVYTDLETWSDTYSYFDITHAEKSDEVTLVLNAITFDADYNMISLPVEGAVITINGEDSEFVTDAEGMVTVVLGDAEKYIISAHSDSWTLVPPVCVVE